MGTECEFGYLEKLKILAGEKQISFCTGFFCFIFVCFSCFGVFCCLFVVFWSFCCLFVWGELGFCFDAFKEIICDTFLQARASGIEGFKANRTGLIC